MIIKNKLLILHDSFITFCAVFQCMRILISLLDTKFSPKYDNTFPEDFFHAEHDAVDRTYLARF